MYIDLVQLQMMEPRFSETTQIFLMVAAVNEERFVWCYIGGERFVTFMRNMRWQGKQG
jgi:hypothetical protein